MERSPSSSPERICEKLILCFGEIITHLFFGFIHIEEEALFNFATWPYNIVPIAKNRILKSYEGNH